MTSGEFGFLNFGLAPAQVVRSIENVHPIGRQAMCGIELFQPSARAVLAEPVAFGFAETEKADRISEHDSLNLRIVVSNGAHSGNGLDENSFGKRSSWAIIDQSVP